MKIMKMIRGLLCLTLLLCLCFTGYLLWQSGADARSQETLQENIARYKPKEAMQREEPETLPDAAEPEVSDTAEVTEPATETEEPEPIVNQSIIDLQNEYPDVVGWITLDDTSIDYPFVQSRDNEDYLRSDLNGDYALAGTVFADYRCSGTDSFLTILYGHNMENGTMFADLGKYAAEEFWEAHTTGTLYLPNATYRLETVAFLVVSSTDPRLYAPGISSESEISDFQEYLQQNAREYRQAELSSNDKVLVLSTCNYEFTGARAVLVLKMTKAQG